MSDLRLDVLNDYFGVMDLCKSIVDSEDNSTVINIRSMLVASGFTEDFIKSYIDKRLSIIGEDGLLLPTFIAEYKNKVSKLTEIKNRYKNIKHNIALVEHVIADKIFDYNNTAECIYDNNNIAYDMPDGFRISHLDFKDSNLCFSRLSSISESVQVPFKLVFPFRCDKCGNEAIGSSEKSVIRCRSCNKNMKYDDEGGGKLRLFYTGVSISGVPVDAYSLIRLPVNQFDAALIPFEREGKYSVLILTYSMPKPFDFSFSWDDSDRVVQFMTAIDEYHKSRVGKYFSGLDHIKMALIYMAWARKCGYVNTNMLVVGPPGCGKSTLSKYYGFTLFSDSLYADSSSTTIPGLIGSGEVMDSAGGRVHTYQTGILERYDWVVLDELLDKPKSELDELKAILEMDMVKSQKHNNKRNVPRRAVVVVASNIPTAHSKNVAVMRRNMEGISSHQTGEIHDMSLNMRSEFTTNNVNWRDGIPYPVLDRFAFAFYLKKKSADVRLNKAMMEGDDGSIREDMLYSLLRTDVFSNYLDEVSNINERFKMDVEGFDGENIDKLLKKYKMVVGSDTGGFGDDIHSLERLQRNLVRMVRFHATMNLRDKSDETDYAFVDKLYSMTCNFVNIEDLVWDVKKKESISDVQSDGVIINFIVKYLDAMDDKAAMLIDLYSACNMAGYKPEEVKRILDHLTSNNHIIFEPPARYRLP